MAAALMILWNLAFCAAEPKPTPLQAGARTVVQAIVKRAAENAALAPNDRRKLAKDSLTAELLRTGAAAALELPEPQRAAAFLVGAGIALDDSPLLRTNLLTRGVCAAVESEAEFKARREVLGEPTIHNRRDLCQHFVVSMALTALAGAEGAEAAGVAKELLDMRGGSGFSFVDLAADLAGVELGKRVTAEPEGLKAIARGFRIEDRMPEIRGLREGYDEARFKKEMGSTSDPRYKDVLQDIRGRIARLDAYRK
jgi:hypothetical protein